MVDFIRRPNEEERRNFKNIMDTTDDETVKFKKVVEAEEKKHHKNKKPFCARCAKFDHRDLIKKQISEMERTNGYADWNQIKTENVNLQEYSGSERFEQLPDSDAMEPTGLSGRGGLERKTKIGIHRNYKCKKRGCGISIFHTNEELEKEKKK